MKNEKDLRWAVVDENDKILLKTRCKLAAIEMRRKIQLNKRDKLKIIWIK